MQKKATLNGSHRALPRPVSGQGDIPICLILKGDSQGDTSSLGDEKVTWADRHRGTLCLGDLLLSKYARGTP